MYAAERNHVSCVTLLFLKESGKQDRDGMSALMYAAQYGYMTVCKTLMYAEAKLTRHDGMTALMLAANNGHELVVSILLEFEAGYQNVEGMTALMLAAQNGHLNAASCCVRRRSLWLIMRATTRSGMLGNTADKPLQLSLSITRTASVNREGEGHRRMCAKACNQNSYGLGHSDRLVQCRF